MMSKKLFIIVKTLFVFGFSEIEMTEIISLMKPEECLRLNGKITTKNTSVKLASLAKVLKYG